MHGIIGTLVGFWKMQRGLSYMSIQILMVRSCLPYFVCNINSVHGVDQGL